MDEIKKDEIIEEVVETTPADEVIEETKDEVITDEVVAEKETTEEKTDEVTEEVTDDGVQGQKEEIADEAPAEETPVVEEVVEEVPVEETPKEELPDLEAITRERDELRAEREMAREEVEFENTIKNNQRVFDDFCTGLANALDESLKSYGIDTTKTIEELKATDPTKAKIAEGLVSQAQAMYQAEQEKHQKANQEKVNNLIYSRASRLIEKFDITPEQADVVAETFVNIVNEVGVKDLGDDLKAKVELAVARGRMLKPKVEHIVEEVKEVVEEIKEDVKDVIEEKAEVVETPAPVIDDSDFKESAAPAASERVETITVDNVMDKLAALPFKDRTRFYKEHFSIIDEAARKHRG